MKRERPLIVSVSERDFYAWTGPSSSDDSGLCRYGTGALHFCAFQIRGYPDLSLNKDLADISFLQRDEIIVRFQERFVDALYRIGLHAEPRGSIGFALRFVVEPSRPFSARIALYLVIRAWSKSLRDREVIEHVADQVFGLFPSDLGVYHMPQPVTSKDEVEGVLGLACEAAYMSEVRKKEQLFRLLTPLPDLSHIYIPFRYVPIQNTMIPVCEVLVKQRHRVTLDVTLVPTALTELEVDVLKKAIVNYNRLTREQRVAVSPADRDTMVGAITDMPADPIAQVALDTFRSSLSDYATGSVFLLACRVLSADRSAVESVTACMARNASRGFDFEVLTSADKEEFSAAQRGYRTLSVSPLVANNEIWDKRLVPSAFFRFHRLASATEAGAFFRLPVPTMQGVPGFSITSRAVVEPRTEPVLRLGVYALRGEPLPDETATLPLRELRQHAFVAGVPGSGKTTTVFSLLHQLWTEHHIPFLVIEPAKSEYRGLCSLKGMNDLLVFTLGDESGVPFRFNPFQLLPGVSVEKHLSNIEGCFRGALPLSGPLPALLLECLEGIYTDLGWDWQDCSEQHPDRPFPTMGSFYKKTRTVTEKKGYSREIEGNIRAALEVRVGGMLRRSIGKMLNCQKGLPADIFMQRPVVLELEALNEEQQALMTMFLLTMVQEYVKATRPSNSPLQHLVVLEEAHNLLGYVDRVSGPDMANPKAHASKYFVKMLAEMRALGEGMLVADQLPSVIASEVVKNTNWKILLRMTSRDDRQIMGTSMLLDAEQFQRTAALPPGEAYVYGERWERPRHVILQSFFAEHTADAVLTERLKALMAERMTGIRIPDADQEVGSAEEKQVPLMPGGDRESREAFAIMFAVLNQSQTCQFEMLCAVVRPRKHGSPEEPRPTLCMLFLDMVGKAFPQVQPKLRLEVYRQFMRWRDSVFADTLADPTYSTIIAKALGVIPAQLPRDPFAICRLCHGCQCEKEHGNPFLPALAALKPLPKQEESK